MRLQDIVPDIQLSDDEQEILISGIFTDSRSVVPESIFVAIKGHSLDGMFFIDQAIERRARVIISYRPVENQDKKFGIIYLHHSEIHLLLQNMVARFYHPSSSRVKAIGVTGTNGKTTTAYLMAHILKSVGYASGMIGTIAYHIGDEVFPSVNTTPGLVEMHQWLSRMADAQMNYCVMEVSSHALDQERVDGIDFVCAVFTNLTDEHLDYHKNKEDYFQAKAKLFLNLPTSACAVINIDDEYGRRLVEMTKARVLTYAIDRPADLKAENCCLKVDGTTFDVHISDFKNKADSVVLQKISTIRDAIARNIGSLAGKRVFPATLEAINRAYDEAAASISAPADANAEKVVATAEIVTFLDKGRALLLSIDDLLISEYDDTTEVNNAMVKEYIHDRQLVNLPTRHTGVHAVCRDAVTKAALEGVVMSIPELDKTGVSDISGIAEIIRMKTGTYRILFTHPDFEDFALTGHVDSGRVLELEVKLKRK